MAKELVAVLVTDNNGEALYNYTGIGSGQTTFVAESGDLISNSLTINDINTTLTVTADKNILSYADNDSCTITATYEGETVSGQTVVFKNGQTVLATKTTNSNGVATYEYESQGIGDITITVECMNLQETYVVEDCLLYRANVSESNTFNVSLPSHFEMTATVTKTASSSAYGYFQVDNYDLGSLTQNGRLFIRKIGDNILASTSAGVVQVNQPTTLKYEYNNGTHTVSANNQLITATDELTTGNFKKLFLQNYTANNLKIKPL